MPSEVHQLWARNLTLWSDTYQSCSWDWDSWIDSLKREETLPLDVSSVFFLWSCLLKLYLEELFVWLCVMQIPNTMLLLEITACSSIFSKYCWWFSNAPCKFIHLLSYLHCKWVCCCLHTSCWNWQAHIYSRHLHCNNYRNYSQNCWWKLPVFQPQHILGLHPQYQRVCNHRKVLELLQLLNAARNMKIVPYKRSSFGKLCHQFVYLTL